MAIVYLPVEATIPGMTSAERAEALNMEVYRLMRPTSVRNTHDVMLYQYTDFMHSETGQHALVADTADLIYINPQVDLTNLLALLPEVPQAEKDGLVMFIDANRGGTVPFGQLIPSTSEQLTEAEAVSLGWPAISN